MSDPGAVAKHGTKAKDDKGIESVWCKLCGWQTVGHVKTSHFDFYKGSS